MGIEYKSWASLDEIPFYDLFMATLPHMEGGTYEHFDGAETSEDKMNHVRKLMEGLLAQPNVITYGVHIDGYLVAVGIGLRNLGSPTEVDAVLSLVRPAENGSRSYIYTRKVETAAARDLYFKSIGLTKWWATLPPTSPVKPSLQVRYGGYTDYEDYDNNQPALPKLERFLFWEAKD